MHASNEGLTPQDIERLQAPLPLADHEARAKGTNKEGTKKQFLIYINQECVIPLLNSIDPNWTWEVQNVHFEPKYVSVTGRLTLKGIARECVGGNSPNGKNSPVDEDTVKGAETDALKRAALRFGVGLYLRGVPTFWIDAELPDWKGAEEALKQFGGWYQREFSNAAKNGQQGTQNSTPQPRQNAPASQTGGATGNSVEQLTNGLGANVTRIEDAPPPNLYVCEKLRVNVTRTSTMFLLMTRNGTNIVAPAAVLVGLQVNGMFVEALAQGMYTLNPAWNVTAELEGDVWRVNNIDAGIAEKAG